MIRRFGGGRGGPAAGAGHFDIQRSCGPGCTDCAACISGEHSDDETTEATSVAVQRDDEADPAVVARLEREVDVVKKDAEQDHDPGLRAFATRRMLLLTQTHPRLKNDAQLDDFIKRTRQQAGTELDTLAAVGAGAPADLALAMVPKGFPLTWSGRVHAALTLGIDPLAVMEELRPELATLTKQAEALPPRLVDKGLPVPLAEVEALNRFELQMAHTKLPAGNVVGDFARATARWAQLRFYGNFALAWEKVADDVSEAVADGSYMPKYHDYLDFTQNKQAIVRDLPARCRERLAKTDEELNAIQKETQGLADATLVAGMGGALAGLLGIMSGWNEGSAQFGQALQITDGRIAGSGKGERIAMAFRWLWDAGYIGAAMGESVDALIAGGPAMLEELAVIIILQMIPGVDVAVDVYLLAKLGADVLKQLVETGLAFKDVTEASNVVAMQRAAGRMARVLMAGGMQIAMALATAGIAKAVSALRARANRIRAENPALTEEQAMRQAMKEAPAAERAPLEATLDPWERSLNPETQDMLRDKPDLRRLFREMDPRVRKLLTRCESPCIPTTATPAEVTRIQGLLGKLRNLNAADELLLQEHFHAGRANLPDAISAVEGASSAAHLRKLLRDAAAGRAAQVPLVLAPLPPPGQGLPGRWGDPASPSYGHAYREHGAHLDSNDFRNRAMSTRANGRRAPDAQFYDNALVVEAEQRAPTTAGNHIVDMYRPIGRVFQIDGSVVSDVQRVMVVRTANGTLRTAYPYR